MCLCHWRGEGRGGGDGGVEGEWEVVKEGWRRVTVTATRCGVVYVYFTDGVKTLIHNKKKAIFHCKTGGYNPNQDALHQLPRHQQTTIFCLRTGHCRLTSHLKRIGAKTSAQCLCGEADQTQEHSLQSCSLHHQARQQIWPTCASLKNQALGVCRGFVPDIQVRGTHERERI